MYTMQEQFLKYLMIILYTHLSLSTDRNEIRSGTVVTYNDRQEILCQKCTDIALNEPEGEGGVPIVTDPNPKPTDHYRSQETTPESTERQVQGEGEREGGKGRERERERERGRERGGGGGRGNV